MTGVQPKVGCPSCGRGDGAVEWVSPSHGRCRFCLSEFDFIAFPALGRRRVAVKPRAISVEADASCFFHSTNQAAKVCDGCGRFLCLVCAVPVGEETLCSTCISNRQKTNDTAVPSRVLWGGICLATAFLPLFFWPTTLFTAPAVLFMSIRGWTRPQSIVQPRRFPFILAGLIASAQLVGWGFLFYTIITR